MHLIYRYYEHNALFISIHTVYIKSYENHTKIIQILYCTVYMCEDLNLKVPIWFNDTESEVEVIWLDVDLNKFDDKIVGGNKKLIMMIAVPDGDIDEFTPLLVNLGQQANISVMDDDRE